MSDPTSTPAGWFPDPLGRHENRYFNGTSWTADVADGGRRYVDPLGTGPGYGHPSHAGPQRNGLATAAMVCGILAVLLAWMPFVVVLGFVLAILALVFGIRGLRRAGPTETGRGFAITGIVTGGIGLALTAVGVALSILVVVALDDFLDAGPVVAEVTSCTIEGRNAIVEGELTNRSDDTRDYSVFVTVDGDVDVFTLDDVPAGATETWTAVTRAPADDVCRPDVDVQGPFPFGIEIDPIES